LLKIAVAQMEIVPGRPDKNTAVMLDMIAQAREQGADMIAFPEFAISGYMLGDTWEQKAFLRECEDCGKEIIKASEQICILFGNVAVDWDKIGDDGRVRKYISFFVAWQGRLWGGDNFPYPFRIKTLHPDFRVFEDNRHFYSLGKLALEMGVRVEELLQPVNINIKGTHLTLGCILCEDGWSDTYAIKPIAATHRNGPVDLFINASSSPFTLGKNIRRNLNFSQKSRQVATPIIYVNNVGVQNNGKTVFTFDGNSTVYSAEGEIIACCPPFRQTLQLIELDLKTGGSGLPALAREKDSGIDSIYRALYYGTSRFLDTIGLNKVVVGVSGGIDSAVSACLYAKILGPERVLLVNMPSKYNSETTKGLAARLAQNLGCLYTVMPIQESVDYTLRQLKKTKVTNLRTGEQFTLAVSAHAAENIQARDRSARILAGVAAAFGGGFACNANKSEMTVGYATLYGDGAGFLAALADLWKHQIYELAQYMNEHVYQQEVIPQEMIELTPSAELSPAQSVDEGKGDPLVYPYHDYLFRAFVERWDRATPEDILLWYSEGVLEEKIGCRPGLVKEIFSGPEDFINDLERWWKLYTGLAVAKRIQAPPVLAVSRRAFGYDHREAQNGPYFTAGYYRLKEQILGSEAK